MVATRVYCILLLSLITFCALAVNGVDNQSDVPIASLGISPRAKFLLLHSTADVSSKKTIPEAAIIDDFLPDGYALGQQTSLENINCGIATLELLLQFYLPSPLSSYNLEFKFPNIARGLPLSASQMQTALINVFQNKKKVNLKNNFQYGLRPIKRKISQYQPVAAAVFEAANMVPFTWIIIYGYQNSEVEGEGLLYFVDPCFATTQTISYHDFLKRWNTKGEEGLQQFIKPFTMLWF
ncbi:MAG: hypothetical protein ISR65_10935 [Bacteriovoracaceae bacterium]|nr:hypothetical protein [Bacteriovoracaceae bacterium]